MKNKHWEAIHELFTRLEKLCGRRLQKPENPLLGGIGTEDAYQMLLHEEGPDVITTEELVRIRAETRNQLDFLRATLEEQYSERDCYLILFPVVAQIDELIQVNFLRTMQLSWPLLQKELFQIDNAGEVFYEILDDIMIKPQTPMFIFEVFYFCLSYGFRGRYEKKPVKIAEYLKKLQARLELEEIFTAPVPVEEKGRLKYFGLPYWNYLISAGVIVIVYYLFLVLGNYLYVD